MPDSRWWFAHASRHCQGCPKVDGLRPSRFGLAPTAFPTRALLAALHRAFYRQSYATRDATRGEFDSLRVRQRKLPSVGRADRAWQQNTRYPAHRGQLHALCASRPAAFPSRDRATTSRSSRCPCPVTSVVASPRRARSEPGRPPAGRFAPLRRRRVRARQRRGRRMGSRCGRREPRSPRYDRSSNRP